MKGRILAVALTVVMVLAVFLTGTQAQVGIGPEPAVESLFARLNSGDLDQALAAFSEDAVARNLVQGRTFAGTREIRQMLAEMVRPNRRLEIVSLQAVGDQTIVTAEVSDRGLAWGTEVIAVGLQDGKVRSFDLIEFRLELWKIAR